MEPGSSDEQPRVEEELRESEQVGAKLPKLASQAAPSIAPLQKDYQVSDAIGKALQAHYRALADEPLPDRFLALLAELEAKESTDEH
jgi:hypothetical protein